MGGERHHLGPWSTRGGRPRKKPRVDGHGLGNLGCGHRRKFGRHVRRATERCRASLAGGTRSGVDAKRRDQSRVRNQPRDPRIVQHGTGERAHFLNSTGNTDDPDAIDFRCAQIKAREKILRVAAKSPRGNSRSGEQHRRDHPYGTVEQRETGDQPRHPEHQRPATGGPRARREAVVGMLVRDRVQSLQHARRDEPDQPDRRRAEDEPPNGGKKPASRRPTIEVGEKRRQCQEANRVHTPPDQRPRRGRERLFPLWYGVKAVETVSDIGGKGDRQHRPENAVAGEERARCGGDQRPHDGTRALDPPDGGSEPINCRHLPGTKGDGGDDDQAT